MIVGTAGHVDHGKSALVEALTGHRMDRLAEERRRGITIDLGFAPLDLGDGRVAGIVDVPGHEDFVRTMVAGASGVDVALLVIAADDGMMPQTREHLAVLERLGVPSGIPVITKADLADPAWVELLASDVAEQLAGSPVSWAAPRIVSARTGAGVDALRAQLVALAATLEPRPADDAFRLPVDRTFSVAGVGTVVTGTAWSGVVAVGDEVRIFPGNQAARVRSIESHGRALTRSVPGARTALGLVGVDRADVARGAMVLGGAIDWTPTGRVDALVTLTADAPRALTVRTRVRVLHGTDEVMARARPVVPVPPGGTGFVRLTLEAPLVVRGNDRFVLRSYSPVRTIGGGRVLDGDPPRTRVWPELLADERPGPRLGALAERRRVGVALSAIAQVLPAAPRNVARVVAAAESVAAVGDLVLPLARRAALEERLVEIVRAHHQAAPGDPGLPLDRVRRPLGVPAPQSEALAQMLVQRRLLRLQAGILSLPGFAPKPVANDADVARVVARLEAAGLAVPTVAELAEELGLAHTPALLRAAERDGRIAPIDRDRFATAAQLDGFVALLRELGAAGEITPGAIRDRTGLSRKYLIPLLEWADRHRWTARVGEARRFVAK